MRIAELCIIVLLALMAACAKAHIEGFSPAGAPKWELAKQHTYKCETAKKRKQKLAFAEKGIEFASACADETPANPACYFWRAVNTGLYYKSRVVGFQKGLKTMIGDCEKIIALDPAYEYGGAYRIMGQIYTEAPLGTPEKGTIAKDIDRALEYAGMAVDMAPDYPENHIVLANARLKAGDFDGARMSLSEAINLLPLWRRDEDYLYWKEEIKKLSQKVRRQLSRVD